jgi:hypothetical protein
MKIISFKSRLGAISTLALSLAFVLVSAGSAQAALTLGATSVTSDAVMTIDGAAASANTLFSATTTGTITVGAGLTTGTYTVGNAVQTGAVVINGAVTGGANSLFANSTTSNISVGSALTTGTYTVGGTTTTGAVTIGRYSGASASSISIGSGATTGAETITLGNGATGSGSAVITIGSNVTTAGNGNRFQGVNVVKHATTAVAVSASATATATQLLNAGIFSVSGTTSTITTDTAANIALAMPGGAATAGDTFSFVVSNGGSGSVTIAGGTGVSLGGSFLASATIGTATSRVVFCQFTSGSAAICY